MINKIVLGKEYDRNIIEIRFEKSTLKKAYPSKYNDKVMGTSKHNISVNTSR